MNHERHVQLMTDFKRAFAKGDAEALAQVITPEFEWHMNWFPAAGAQSTGKVLRGLDEVMAEIRWRAANWSQVRFDGVEERYLIEDGDAEDAAGDLVVQTFTISGQDENGEGFQVDAVDLYRIVDGRLTLKDTYWKHPSNRS